MLDAYHLKKVLFNVKLLMIEVAKRKKVVFKLPFKILSYFNHSNCEETTEAKDSGKWLIHNFFFVTITGHQK
jgi:hypothetical protein